MKRTVPSERESGSESQVAGRRPTLKGQMLLLFPSRVCFEKKRGEGSDRTGRVL